LTDDIYVLGLGYNNQKILVEYKDLMIVAAAVYGQSFEKSVLLVCRSHCICVLGCWSIIWQDRGHYA
jgi:hypothetical protein